MSDILQFDQVCKTYQQHKAVDRVSFNLPRGCIFGLLGPNGAGKTSLIRIITYITQADSGKILFNGTPLNSSHPEKIGYMPEERGMYKKMKVGDHLIYLAQLKGFSKNDAKQKVVDWLEKFEIKDWWNKKIEELSKGMQQKIQFIATVVHEPELIILDEPFTGLDPVNANLIKDEISRLQKNGSSIIFSTHRMEQVEEICDQIVLINQGKIILEGQVGAIRQQFKKNQYLVEFSGQASETLLQRQNIQLQSEHQLLVQGDGRSNAQEVLRELFEHDLGITAFRELLPSMNEIFIEQVSQVKH